MVVGIFHLYILLCINNLVQNLKYKKCLNNFLWTTGDMLLHDYFLHICPTPRATNSKPNEYKNQSTT